MVSKGAVISGTLAAALCIAAAGSIKLTTDWINAETDRDEPLTPFEVGTHIFPLNTCLELTAHGKNYDPKTADNIFVHTGAVLTATGIYDMIPPRQTLTKKAIKGCVDRIFPTQKPG